MEGNCAAKAEDFFSERLETEILLIGTALCLPRPVAMAEAIVPQPTKPRLQAPDSTSDVKEETERLLRGDMIRCCDGFVWILMD